MLGLGTVAVALVVVVVVVDVEAIRCTALMTSMSAVGRGRRRGIERVSCLEVEERGGLTVRQSG